MLVLSVLSGAAAAGPDRTPAPGPLRIIGGPGTGGCIAGATQLPPEGIGFQTIHASHASFWGAPETIAGMTALGRAAAQAGLPTLLVEDISFPRGGPMPGGHVSHQIGLDVDVALDMRPRPPLTPAARDSIDIASLVRADRRGVETARWNDGVVTLLRLAAGLPGVDRVLVNAAIKRQLCDTVTGDRTWLRRIRPWYGHAAHMHISFACPPGQPECVAIAPPPPGDGCDATLQWWFDQLDAPPAKRDPGPPPKPRRPPAACAAILTGG